MGMDQDMIAVFWRSVYSLSIAFILLITLMACLVFFDVNSKTFHSAIVIEAEIRNRENRTNKED